MRISQLNLAAGSVLFRSPTSSRPFATSRRHLRARFAIDRRSQTPSDMTTTATTLKGQPLDRGALENLLRRRMFFTPSFEIYGGVSGLYDYGPPGTALQSNLLDIWRKHFILEEQMLEVDCTVLTPETVFKTSGHVEKFADWMCKDPKTGDILRADHFVEDMLEERLMLDKKARGEEAGQEKKKDAKREKKKAKGQVAVKLDNAVAKEYEEVLAQIDNYNGDELGELIKKYDLRNPASGEMPSPPVAFNLMFQTSIGPSNNLQGYLRPETAQGQFMNFAKLLDFNMGQMPFASASIGKSYRNEISPRGGLLRVREFLMGEIEHFVDPDGNKRHDRFAEVEHVELELLDRHTQLAGKTTIQNMAVGQAVKDNVIDNETLGYFLARIRMFLEKIGIDMTKVRFRQHMANEMAHYACDCWDAEILTSSGWVECVGCADRSAYDLSVHSKATGKPLVVRERLDTPRSVSEWQVDIDRKKFGPFFKRDATVISNVLLETSQQQREEWAAQLKSTGRLWIDVPGLSTVELGQDIVTIEYRTRTENVREYTPNVVEPSFGFGRIIVALCEHNYWTRAADEGGDEARGVLSFPPIMAPTKVLVVPLSSNEAFKPALARLLRALRANHVSYRVDDSSATIGKRYSRNDEVGTPLGITIDFQTVKDGTVTLRDRDSMKQVRGAEAEVVAAVADVAHGRKSWADVEKELPAFEGQALDG